MTPAQARRILKPIGGFFEVARQTTSGHILLKNEGYTADELEAVACLARHAMHQQKKWVDEQETKA